MNYWSLISESFALVRRRPYLWLLALFAGGIPAASYSMPGGVAGPSNQCVGRRAAQTCRLLAHLLRPHAGGLPAAFSDPRYSSLLRVLEPILVTIIVIVLVIAIILFVVGPLAQGAVVSAINLLQRGQADHLGQALARAPRWYWRIMLVRLLMLGLAILMALPWLILARVAISTMLSGSTMPVGARFWLVLMVILSTLLSVFAALAERAIVVGDLGVASALSEAAALLRHRLGPVAMVWLIAVATSIAWIIAVFVAALAYGILVAAGVVMLMVFGAKLIGGLVVAAAAGLGLVVLIVAAAALVALLSVLWTSLYLRLRIAPVSPLEPS